MLTFVVRFRTAQFKLHFQKLARRTYLIPPPSAVAGLFGAILGIPRDELRGFCERNRILAGADLRSLGGLYVTLTRIHKFDRSSKEILQLLNEWSLHKPSKGRKIEDVYKDMMGLLPLKESEELFEPEYKFAIAATDSVVREGFRRLHELDFEYEIFGGNDYNFVDHIGEPREARLYKTRKGSGYCPTEELQSIEARNYTIIMDADHFHKEPAVSPPFLMSAPMGSQMERFTFAYGATLLTKTDRDAVDDGESTIFVYDPTKYLVP
jgi:CRISPR-associated Cas5-like protein